MKINIVGQYGFANVGDEGILQAIMDSLGLDHEYIVSTSLPFNLIGNYHFRLPSASNVRTLDDERMDYDACIYGGGKVDWGFGWGHFIRAFNANKKTMAYGIALRTDQDNTKLRHLYEVFFNQFQRVTVRDMATKELLVSMLNNSTLTMCPAINLKEQKTSCPEGAIAVCPRYGDYNQKGEVDNEPQIQWFISHLKDTPKNKIMLIPFYPKDLEGKLRDLELCNEINRRLGGGCYIFPCDGYNARKVKYAISKSAVVMSGGRYHAIVWAIAHSIPYTIAPTIGEPALSKLQGLKEMHEVFGRQKLLNLEYENKKLFEEIAK
jgi:polysaccharide pyruvyl transferase WcaK-like protein